MIRSLLNTPADHEGMLLKAIETNADALIFDLEDGVQIGNKENARIGLRRIWNKVKIRKRNIFIRINDVHTIEGIKDINFLFENNIEPCFIILPKVESGIEVQLTRKLFKKSKLCPIIETSKGVTEAKSIINSLNKGEYLIFGEADLSSQLRISLYSTFIKEIKRQLVLLSNDENVGVIDSPCFRLKDESFLTQEVQHSYDFGFSSKIAIHPSHISIINKVFSPRYELSYDEIQILEQYKDEHSGIKVNNGDMVGPPMVRMIREKEEQLER